MKSKPVKILIAFGIIAVALLGIAHSMFAAVGRSGKVMVMIPKGSSASQVAEILAEKGIVRSAVGFKLLARVTGQSCCLKPGAYELDPSAGPRAALDKIARGDVSARWITIPEGYTLRQIGERIEAEKSGSADRFVELARNEGRSFDTSFTHPGDNLEGYLYPDTYLVPIGASEESIIKMMLDAFTSKVADPLADEISRSGMSLHDCITLASLVEREARIPKDRRLISAVIHNRLRIGMPLQIDATVLYALGYHKERVLYRDYEIDSPYNTYRNPGLPPGPIASPGLESIKAALHPADVRYLYYVARPDGSHIFTHTFDEHKQAQQRARRERAN